jgi:peptidoglycan/LPS O-acetylase OafA/YrhL
VLYIWHYPLFWYLSKNETEWSGPTRTLLAYVITLLIAVATQLLIERPVRRWLASERWHAHDRGIGPALVAAARRGRDEARERIRATRHHAERDDELTGL